MNKNFKSFVDSLNLTIKNDELTISGNTEPSFNINIREAKEMHKMHDVDILQSMADILYYEWCQTNNIDVFPVIQSDNENTIYLKAKLFILYKKSIKNE